MSGDRAGDHTDHRTLPLYQAASVKQDGKRERQVAAVVLAGHSGVIAGPVAELATLDLRRRTR
jgi:hypothetical protein